MKIMELIRLLVETLLFKFKVGSNKIVILAELEWSLDFILVIVMIIMIEWDLIVLLRIKKKINKKVSLHRKIII
jgi:hypothetical protein